MDGASYFQFGLQSDDRSPVSKAIIPFFTRRMGLNSSGGPIPINVGAKITGQVDNWNIGMMYMNDARKVGNNNFSVARVTRNIGKQSSVGMIGTMGNAIGEESNLVIGADLKLSTSTFQGNKNAAFILFGLKSNTNEISENDGTWGGQFVYPNDLINARLGHHQIGKNFVSGMGFVPRTDIKETYGSVEFGPRPNQWGIMQVLFGASFDYITNFDTGNLETRDFGIQPFGIRFLSGEEISYLLASQYELLTENFNIFENFVIPKGKYEWWQHQIQLETKGARNLWGEAAYGFGEFYNGKRQDIKLQMNWKIAVPFFIGGTFNQNRVKLPEGSFKANIYQLNANVLFSPDITLYNYFQYDNASKSAGWQSRFQWIVKPGNEIILAWTSNFRKPADRFFMDESAVRLKLKYNIRL